MSDTHYCENTKHTELFPQSECSCGRLYTEAEVRERELQAATEMFDRFWDAAALMGVPAGQYTPASLIAAVAQEVWREVELEGRQ